MDSTQDIELQDPADDGEDSTSVDDFIRQLEEKEKDLHITADTTIIEIAAGFDDGDVPDFLKDDFSFETPAKPPATIKPAVSRPAPIELQNELASLKQKLSKMDEERAEMFKNSQRRNKDFETLKARTEKERMDTFQNQIGNLATLMLPALDNLDRALDAAEHLPGEKNDSFQQFFDGIVLVNQQVRDILGKMGILPIPTVGEKFDPHFHEAVAIEETDDLPPDTISAEMLRGYYVGDRIIRHSMVRVAKPAGSNFSGAKPESPAEEAKPDLETFRALAELDGDTDFDEPEFEIDSHSQKSDE
jgi:molecular chaperone GrpE